MEDDEIDRLLDEIGLEEGFEDGAGWSFDLPASDERDVDYEQDW